MSRNESLHFINNYIHSVSSLLGYIKEDAVIDNIDTKEMLELAIKKESQVFIELEKLKEQIGSQNG